MAKFTLEFDVKIHDHSPTAHRAVIGQLLATVAAAVGSGQTDRGDIVLPPGGAQPARAIGSWEIDDLADLKRRAGI